MYILISLKFVIYLLGRIDFNLKSDLEEKFRKEVYKRKGMKKGNITEAITEALEEWIEKKK